MTTRLPVSVATKRQPVGSRSVARDHWGIENRLHYVRDVTFGEDASRIRNGAAPQILAACRNTAISLLRSWGCQNIAAALRDHAYHPRKLLAKLGFFKK